MAELSHEERALLNEAVEIGKALGRPFTESEVLYHAKRQGYALRLAFDYRFVKVAERKGRQMPLWIVDEDQDRLNRCYMADFFGALADYARRCYSEATGHASDILAAEQLRNVPNAERSNRDQLVYDYLARQGWTFESEVQ